MEIVLCDDHRLLAELLSEYLVQAGHQVEVVSRPRDAVAHVARRRVDVCVLDLGYPPDADEHEVTPTQAIRHLTEHDCRVLVLSGWAEAAQRREALEAGASDYLVKGEPISALLEAVERPDARGPRGSVDADTERRGRERPAPWSHASLGSFLTPRERSVLDGLVQGESTVLLARRLGVRPATARTHVQNLLGKLCVHSRLEAVALAVEHGIAQVADEAG